ncbi:GIY-YIG nuclease family protein [Cohnella fermenti]|uniref:GIY-YIG catalytic domain-containing protein n=1 Tax=Cohnella fermenti TaxID=2565925 RepID=A0A4S4CB84_9BACL|nr:hypothetical protein [Cohnella fermenti]THF84703.1 hypothetical protein E6C55_01660 [Cohnella fermenti]
MSEFSNDLSINLFNPLFDNPKIIPHATGVYCITTNSINQLPSPMQSLNYSYLNSRPVIYVGISNRSLRTRDYRSHFNGNARGSTLRKSLGSLFGLERIQSNNDIGTSKYKFSKADELKLSDWMKENINLHFFVHPEPSLIEKEVIDYFKPPLNIKDNHNVENIEFRSYLMNLRKF